MRYPLVIGNWKLNGSKQMVIELITSLRNKLNLFTGCKVAIAPPAIYLDQVNHQLSGSNISLGAQNVDINISGAYTGEISAIMLKDVGSTYIIIGHSERRAYHKESDVFIAKKFGILKATGLIPVLCVGETAEENEAGKTEAVVARQLDAVLKKFGSAAFKDSVIAYEPIWAIGRGQSAIPSQAQSVHKFIRNHIAKQDKTVANQVIIQYGGSVNTSNAAALFTQPDIDGALVGGFSLKAEAFSMIIKSAAAAKRIQ